MRWQGRRESENVEDRRDEGGADDEGGGGGFGFPFPGGGGGGFQIPMGQGGGGIGIIGLIVIAGIALLLGVDPRMILSGGGGEEMPGGRHIQLPSDPRERNISAEDDSMKKFVSVVLADTEDTWSRIFAEKGLRYASEARAFPRGGSFRLRLWPTCRWALFYCPNDRKIYVDLSFYEMLKRRFKAPGEFAQAYVIAHEVGHHIQNLQGRLDAAQRLQAAASGPERNAIQVRVELQADCYAGVWAKNTDRINKILEPGDIEAALRAAAAIGDDAIQKSTRGYAVPDLFHAWIVAAARALVRERIRQRLDVRLRHVQNRYALTA